MPPPSLAHSLPPELPLSPWGEFWRAWSLEPMLVFSLLMVAWVYRRGAKRLRTSVGRGRGLRGWEVACFWAGWWTLVVALVSPLHPWGQILFSAHMTQHELLMVAAAPLLVLGRPAVAMLFAIPRCDARDLARFFARSRLRPIWHGFTRPVVAWAVHAAALWLWHVPALFEATLRHEFVHHLQHASFFGSALLFWWALMHRTAGWPGFGVAVLYLFTTMLHSGLLGALLTFAQSPLYPSYVRAGGAGGLTPLEDQQLGGLIMWVPAGLVYLVAALALLAGWMRYAARRDLATNVTALPRIAAVLLPLLFLGCGRQAEREAAAFTGGDPHAGRRIIREAGCAACHTIPGIPGARATVGPPLTGIAARNYIGGVLTNDPENLIRWIMDPSAQSPKTVMPNLGLQREQARDVAAYLYTLRE